MEEQQVNPVTNGDKPEEIVIESATPQDIEIKVDGNTEMSVREKELLDTVFQLESDKSALIEETRTKLSQAKKEYEDCRQENEKLKKKNAQLEQTLIQKEAQSTEPKSKKEQDELLLKAKTLLFEKTKVCKQQEQHIAVLKTQVDSVKEVLAVTKEMLNLRNTESDHIQERLKTIETCRQAEKERTALLERKLEISQEAYKKLRQEYDCQSSLNKELKINYLLKIQLLTDELEKAKGGTVAEVKQ